MLTFRVEGPAQWEVEEHGGCTDCKTLLGTEPRGHCPFSGKVRNLLLFPGRLLFPTTDHIVNSREDACVNDTWLHAWNSMPPHRPSALRIFLAKITRRVALNRWKAASAQKRGGGQLPLVLDELSECVSGQEDAEGAVEARELRRLLDQFIRELPAREAIFSCGGTSSPNRGGEIARQWGPDGKPCPCC